MARGVAQGQERVHCRYCGHADSGNFCSQCGLSLDQGAQSQTLRSITSDRLQVLFDPWQRLGLTLLLLLIHPCRFFRTLETEGIAVSRIRIWSCRGEQTDRPRRPPLTTSGYLFVVAILGAISVNYVDDEEVVGSLVESGVNFVFKFLLFQRLDFLSHIRPLIPDKFSPILVEFAAIVLLFALKMPYKVMLGIRSDRVYRFTEYFLYTSVQFLLLVNCLLILVVMSGGWSQEVGVIVMFIIVAYSIWYFLAIPLRLFPTHLCVSGMRVFFAYIGMVLVTPYFIVSLPLFYTVYILYRLYRYGRGVLVG